MIKDCKKFGASGGHIVMTKDAVDKSFLILPESSKWILQDVLKQYQEDLSQLTNPLLSEVLNKKEMDLLKKIYKKEIESFRGGYIPAMRNNFLKNTHTSLINNELRVSDINSFFNEAIKLPKDLKRKLIIFLNKD